MRLAMFTNKFPIKGDTFFARDLRSLTDAGISVDVFPLHPVKADLWQWVPEILDEIHFHRDWVHTMSLGGLLAEPRVSTLRNISKYLRDATGVGASGISYGVGPFAKSMYAVALAWVWANKYGNNYDHIMSYWGNFAATCAHCAHRLTGRNIPISMLLHAGTDLYRNQVYMEEKLLYADNVFVVCDFNRAFIRDRFPSIYPAIEKKVMLHHLGLDFTEMKFEREGRLPATVLGVGRFDKLKGFDYVLRAVKKLDERGIHADVQLLGDGDERNALASLARDLGISSRVQFPGWRPFSEVQSAMKRATILVHASADIGDAVPTVIKEAAALGTPVVATQVAGIPELLDNGKSGLIVPPRDEAALADAMEKFLTNPVLRETYAAAGRAYAEKNFDLWSNGRLLAQRLSGTVRGSHGAL